MRLFLKMEKLIRFKFNFIFSKHASYSVVEMPLVVLLLSSVLFYFGGLVQANDVSYSYNIESVLDAIYYEDSNRLVFMSENLSSSSLTANWTNISIILNSSFINYEFIISNKTVSKTIYNCSSRLNKYFIERLISIENNTNFEFRKVKLGVCY